MARDKGTIGQGKNHYRNQVRSEKRRRDWLQDSANSIDTEFGLNETLPKRVRRLLDWLVYAKMWKYDIRLDDLISFYNSESQESKDSSYKPFLPRTYKCRLCGQEWLHWEGSAGHTRLYTQQNQLHVCRR